MSESNNLTSQRWSSLDLHPRERFDAWNAALNSSHLGWSLDKHRETDFAAEVQVSKLPDLQVVRCHCQPCSGFRGKHEISADLQAYYGLLLMFQGEEEVTVASQSALIKPGEIFIWDSTEPIRFKLHSPIQKITVLIPQERLNDVLPQTRKMVGKAMDWHQGMGAVAASHITSLCSQASHIKIVQACSTAEITLDLIALSLGNQQLQKDTVARSALVERIRTYIENNLDNLELRPQMLADRFHISLRYLYQLFTQEDQTVARWIQERRLEKCRRDLLVAGPHKNITEIAMSWGFNDATHFSRAFKKRYGDSPREYRQKKSFPAAIAVTDWDVSH